MNNSSIIQDQIDGEQDDKGFTLIEILIAIVLVGILSAVAVVGISNLVSKGELGIVQRDWRLRQRRHQPCTSRPTPTPIRPPSPR